MMMISLRQVRRGVLLASLPVMLGAFKGPDEPQAIKARRKATLAVLMQQLETAHYSLKPINVKCSEAIWTNYLTNLDYNKGIFLQEDIDSLRSFRDNIDDELHSNDLDFFEAVLPIYHKRLGEVELLCKEFLSRPFNYTLSEDYKASEASAAYPSGVMARNEKWHTYLKYLVLRKMVDLQEQTRGQSDAKTVPDTAFESQARAKTLRWVTAYIRSLGNDDARFENYLNTITFYMDPHTAFLSPISATAMNTQMTHTLCGLGMHLEDKEGDCYIKDLAPGGPAWKSGLPLEGQQILKVGQDSGALADAGELTLPEISHLIQGPKGTLVRLMLRDKNGNTATYAFTRDEIRDNSDGAKSAIVVRGGKKIGYVRLPLFYDDNTHAQGAHCANDVDAEVQKLLSAHVDGLIIDLRDNPGGSLPQVVQMAGLFIPKGPVVQVATRVDRSVYTKDSADKRLYTLPMAIMVNQGSASASEIFTAAMQDYHRAVVVGAPTYGKGTVQKGIRLMAEPDGRHEELVGTLRLTIEKFYRITGASTQIKGVTPDIILPDEGTYRKNREKDNPSALPWDTVPGADYRGWADSPRLSAICPLAEQKIAASPVFQTITENTLWMHEHENDPIPLNLSAYKKQQMTLNARSQQAEEARKLSPGQALQVLGTGNEPARTSQSLTPYQSWLKSVGSDVYVDQTSDILLEMMHP